jgi:hypothetical protein
LDGFEPEKRSRILDGLVTRRLVVEGRRSCLFVGAEKGYATRGSVGFDWSWKLELEGSVAEETFVEFVAREKARLHGEREAIFEQQQELETKLEAINREFAAIDAYEATKAGRTIPIPIRGATARAAGTGASTAAPRARRGSKREALLQLIRENAAGLTRGEILERMGLKGDKAGEMSVSNALTALTKGKQVMRAEGRYRVV